MANVTTYNDYVDLSNQEYNLIFSEIAKELLLV